MVSRPFEEFRADFVLVGRRALRDAESTALIPLFNLAYVAGADQKICERRLKLYRGAFDLQTAAIKSIVGRAYITTEPYALYPTTRYVRDAEQQNVIDYQAIKRGSRLPSSMEHRENYGGNKAGWSRILPGPLSARERERRESGRWSS